jgi:poly(beta-D-mannuronate) lyase
VLKWLSGVLSLSFVAVIPIHAAGPLISPWDTHRVTPTEAPYDCPEPAHLPVDFVTDGFYALNDPTHSIIDPVRQKEYDRTSGPVKNEGNVVVAAADNFRRTGSEAAAACVIHHMEVDAKDRALTGKLSSSQAYFVQGWVAGAEAIAYLKVDGAHRTTAAQRAVILPWLEKNGELTRSFYDSRAKQSGGGAQNHFYWAAVIVAAPEVCVTFTVAFRSLRLVYVLSPAYSIRGVSGICGPPLTTC